MMLLNIYIKPTLAAFTFVLLLSACASIDEEQSDQEKLKSTSKDIIELVDVNESSTLLNGKEGVLNENAINSWSQADLVQNASKTNQYVKQQALTLTTLPESVIVNFEQALEFMKEKQWPQANKQLDKVIKAAPNLSGSYVNKAIVAMKLKQLNVATQWIDKAITTNSSNPYAHHIKGQISRFTGDFIQAEQSYLKALSLWPSYKQVHLDMAILLELYRGELLQSRHYYQNYLALNSADVEAQKWLAGLNIKIARAGLVEKKVNKESITKEKALAKQEFNE